MVQSEIAIEAYNSYWNGIVPAASITWMVLILIIACIAIRQARTFVNKF